ncbi:MAG: TetR/AcrR family transcriptional regulator [Acidimicrobiales bacterium]
MSRLVPSPQELLDQLRRLPPHTAASDRDGEPTSVERILDAALAAFSEQGVKATTMTRVARDAGVSREWLYRQFANRDAVVVAVAQREAGRFMEGLVVRAFQASDLDSAVTEAFVYSVEFLRDHALLQQVLRTEFEIVTGRVLLDAASIVGTAVAMGAGYLSALGDLESEQATVVAETLVRLAAAVTLAPSGALDLHHPDQLRRYAATIVPGVIAAARTAVPTPASAPTGRKTTTG